MGGCIGCSIALTLAASAPERVTKLVLYSPAGGPRYRMTQQSRFAQHAAFVREQGMAALVELARSSARTFTQDPRIGPWAAVVGPDLDVARYLAAAEQTVAALFEREYVPGPAPERLLALEVPALVVPGHDPTHATSAARYLEECLPQAQYWDVLPDEQTAENAPRRVLDFLQE